MTALYPTISPEGKPLYQVTGSTGNTRALPLALNIGVRQYSESLGFGGMGIIMQIECVGVTAPAENVLLEMSKTRDFAQFETLATEPFASKAVGDVITVKLEPNVGHVRVNNLTSGDIQVRYWRRPSKLSA